MTHNATVSTSSSAVATHRGASSRLKLELRSLHWLCSVVLLRSMTIPSGSLHCVRFEALPVSHARDFLLTCKWRNRAAFAVFNSSRNNTAIRQAVQEAGFSHS